MGLYLFEVPGEAVAWRRPRFRGKAAFTDPEVVAFKNLVKLAFREAAVKGAWPVPIRAPAPVVLEVTFYRVPPKKLGKRGRESALAGQLAPTTRPDADNLAKGVKDALNGLAYDDDAQVVRLVAEKAYHHYPATVVSIQPWKPQKV